MYKVVALDLDGTILNSDKKISENSKRVLQTLVKEHPETEIVLASGRAPYLVVPTETESGVDCSLIGYNGGLCLSKKSLGRKLVFNKPIPSEYLSSIYKFVEENNYALNVYGDGIVYATTRHQTKANNYAMMTGAKYEFINSYFDLVGNEKISPAKCLIILEDNDECDRLLESLKPVFPQLSLVKSNCSNKTCKQYYVEFLQNGVNKGTSIEEFCRVNNYKLDQVVAFGDAENDIDMLKAVGLGVCLANGTEPTKAISKQVSQYTNDQDGVARELIKLFNLNIEL